MEEFRRMRRKNRELTRDQAEAIIAKQNWGVLSVQGDGGYPYGVPVNYGFTDGKIYIHSTAGESHKADAIHVNPKVCLTVVARHDLVAAAYTTRYESAIVFGTARIVTEFQEKCEAAKKMMSRLAPDVEKEAIESCGHMRDMVIIEITPEHISGKAN